MIIAHLINTIKKELSSVYQDELLCESYAWWMLEAITNKTKTELLVLHNIVLTTEQENKLSSWIEQQQKTHIPLAYLIGSVPFNGLIIDVKPPVLIPRPETEEWVLALIEKLTKLSNQKLNILDLCTGSGCIGLAIAKALPKSQVVATDISEQALHLAKHNAQKNHIPNITFVKSDLFEQLSSTFKFDLIVANPPYVAEDEWEALDASVKNWEDRKALLAADHGLSLIQQIIQNCPDYLKPNPELYSLGIHQLYIEIGYQQGPSVKQLFEKFSWQTSEIYKDLEKNDRVVSGSL